MDLTEPNPAVHVATRRPRAAARFATVGAVLAAMTLTFGIAGAATASARSTSGFESPGNNVLISASDNQGGRTINYVWTNGTGSTKCVRAF
jgi:hypothetical protein